MKKLLLTLAAVALGASANATAYKVFDIANQGKWAGDAKGYSTVVSFGDVKFNISSAKGASTTDLISPVDNTFAWRVYKGSEFTISSATVDMKSVIITYDDYSEGKYIKELVLSDGWTGSLESTIYTCVNAAGDKSFTGKAEAAQVRIKSIVVTDGEGDAASAQTPTDPGTPENPDVPQKPEFKGYTIFDITTPGEWTGDANGYQTTVTAGGKVFALSTAKADSSTDLISPVANNFAWRVYKGSTFTITAEGTTMKSIQITYDDYENGKYVKELELPEGWSGTIEDALYTLKCEAGATTFTAKAKDAQVRIKKIMVSEDLQGGQGGGPVVPDGVIYQNDFTESISDWKIVNDETIGDYNGWKVNASPKCAVANSYYGDKNHAAKSILMKSFDLKDCTDVKVSFSQAFGYYFPSTQEDFFRVFVIDETVAAEVYTYLTMTAFPPAPEKGNWTKEWAVNEFDLSEYDGGKITIGFEYNNPGGEQSYAWELKDFVLKGNNVSGVENIVNGADEAPVYYNMQGVRVANPESGLHIVVKCGKATKVLF